jgi:hypothetical protein
MENNTTPVVDDEDFYCEATSKEHAHKIFLEATKNYSHYACREYRQDFERMKNDIRIVEGELK